MLGIGKVVEFNGELLLMNISWLGGFLYVFYFEGWVICFRGCKGIGDYRGLGLKEDVGIIGM